MVYFDNAGIIDITLSDEILEASLLKKKMLECTRSVLADL